MDSGHAASFFLTEVRITPPLEAKLLGKIVPCQQDSFAFSDSLRCSKLTMLEDTVTMLEVNLVSFIIGY